MATDRTANLVWKRTEIGGEELRHDFCAYVENILIARILRQTISENRVVWTVAMQVGDAIGSSSQSRREAILCVENEFARFLESDAGKADPQTWPHDQRSMQLRHLKVSDRSACQALLDDLRSGRVQRIERRKP